MDPDCSPGLGRLFCPVCFDDVATTAHAARPGAGDV